MKIKNLIGGLMAAILSSVSIAAMADTDTQPQSKNVGTAITDSAITTKVKAMYVNDSRLKDAVISVSTANGVVTLTGSAPSSDAKDAASSIARSVDGVSSVNSELLTPSITSKIEKKTKSAAKKTERVVSDSWITTKVKSSLLADSITKGFVISVKTVHHAVTLSGTVDSQASVDQAVSIAKQVDGVDSVDAAAVKIFTK